MMIAPTSRIYMFCVFSFLFFLLLELADLQFLPRLGPRQRSIRRISRRVFFSIGDGVFNLSVSPHIYEKDKRREEETRNVNEIHRIGLVSGGHGFARGVVGFLFTLAIEQQQQQ
jgi:hypothetical protein